MRQTAVEWLYNHLFPKQLDGFCNDEWDKIDKAFEQAKEMDMQQKKDAYQHGRDDENCALSDGAMAPDYENADEWYQGEYGGEK